MTIDYTKTPAYDKAKSDINLKKTVENLDDLVGMYRQTNITLDAKTFDKLISKLAPHDKKNVANYFKWHFATVRRK